MVEAEFNQRTVRVRQKKWSGGFFRAVRLTLNSRRLCFLQIGRAAGQTARKPTAGCESTSIRGVRNSAHQPKHEH
jgi:hypothetical protein